MSDSDKRVLPVPESTVAHRLTVLFAGIGLALAIAALALVGVFGARDALLVLFWCGWAVLGAAMIGGLLTMRSPLPIGPPLAVLRFGIVTLILAFGMEALSGASMKPLSTLGALVMLAGIGWALWNIGELRK